MGHAIHARASRGPRQARWAPRDQSGTRLARHVRHRPGRLGRSAPGVGPRSRRIRHRPRSQAPRGVFSAPGATLLLLPPPAPLQGVRYNATLLQPLTARGPRGNSSSRSFTASCGMVRHTELLPPRRRRRRLPAFQLLPPRRRRPAAAPRLRVPPHAAAHCGARPHSPLQLPHARSPLSPHAAAAAATSCSSRHRSLRQRVGPGPADPSPPMLQTKLSTSFRPQRIRVASTRVAVTGGLPAGACRVKYRRCHVGGGDGGSM
jgi:hypothetical protein